MLKDFMWQTFKNTGSIDAYLCYKQIKEGKDENEEENSLLVSPCANYVDS